MDIFHNTCIGAETVINATEPIIATKLIYSTNSAVIFLIGGTIVFALGAFGNGTFLLSVLKAPAMKSSATAFLSNVAIADAFFLAHITLWGYLDYWTSDVAFDHPVGSNLGCYALLMATSVPYHVSLVFVTLISVERYLAICKPMKHRVMRGTKRTYKMIASGWLIGIALALVRVIGNKLLPTCILWPAVEEFSHLPVHVSFCDSYMAHPHIMAISTYFVFLSINWFLSVKILSALKNRGELTSGQEQVQTARTQVTRTLLVNNITFFLCQFPMRIAHFNKTFGYLSNITLLDEDQYQAVFIIGYICLLLNSCINPIIYVCCCRIYRRAMAGALKKVCCRCLKVSTNPNATGTSTSSSTVHLQRHNTNFQK